MSRHEFRGMVSDWAWGQRKGVVIWSSLKRAFVRYDGLKPVVVIR